MTPDELDARRRSTAITPAEFKALRRSQQVQEVVMALADMAESMRFRCEEIPGVEWSERYLHHYRSLHAAAAVLEYLLAEGAKAATDKKELPRWLAAMLNQLSGEYLSQMPRSAPTTTNAMTVSSAA